MPDIVILLCVGMAPLYFALCADHCIHKALCGLNVLILKHECSLWIQTGKRARSQEWEIHGCAPISQHACWDLLGFAGISWLVPIIKSEPYSVIPAL